MATNKQVKMLLARSKAAGMEASWEDFEDLENGAVDDKLKEIEEFGKKGTPQPEKKETSQPVQINNVRLGLACKLVLQKCEVAWAIENPDKYVTRVKEVYALLNKAEAAVAASSSSSSEEIKSLCESVIPGYTEKVQDDAPSCRAGICDFCQGSFNRLRLLSPNAFVCGSCAWKNSQDNKADGGLLEVTNPTYIEAAWQQRKAVI